MKNSTLVGMVGIPAALAASVLPASAGAGVSEWVIDSVHTTAEFAVKHMMVSTVRGTFSKVTGKAGLDDQDPTKSVINIDIDAASINTREPKRDDQLRSADFFDVAKTPTITFKSTRIDKKGKGKFAVTGDLTMRGVTKAVTLDVTGPTAPVKTPWGTLVRGISAKGKINRKDWGLIWNKVIEAGGVLVGEEVEISFDAELNPVAK